MKRRRLDVERWGADCDFYLWLNLNTSMVIRERTWLIAWGNDPNRARKGGTDSPKDGSNLVGIAFNSENWRGWVPFWNIWEVHKMLWKGMYHVIIISTVVVGDRAINGDIPGKIVTLLFIIINVVCSTEAASPGNLLLPCLVVWWISMVCTLCNYIKANW